MQRQDIRTPEYAAEILMTSCYDRKLWAEDAHTYAVMFCHIYDNVEDYCARVMEELKKLEEEK